jgi:hypothetical protein
VADYDESPSGRQGRADWSGTIIGLATSPVFFLFVYLGKAEMGFTVSLVLAVIIFAIKRRWQIQESRLVLGDNCSHIGSSHSTVIPRAVA